MNVRLSFPWVQDLIPQNLLVLWSLTNTYGTYSANITQSCKVSEHQLIVAVLARLLLEVVCLVNLASSRSPSLSAPDFSSNELLIMPNINDASAKFCTWHWELLTETQLPDFYHSCWDFTPIIRSGGAWQYFAILVNSASSCPPSLSASDLSSNQPVDRAKH